MTSEDLAATSSGAMAAAGGGTAVCFDPADVCPKAPPGFAASKKTTAKPMTCKLLAKRCFPSVFFIFFSVHTAGILGFRPGVLKIIIPGAFKFYLAFILRFESKVSGVSVQDMLLRKSFLTPKT
ncbi:MAG: hypothetical protein V2I40_01720 [Desulfobacteraceae bacterium]|jgi:hypothetical protein|nr:hypothetical protein [Desulfobacteraceae bacterium]